jgi:uncharacterized delta-60 repeat protein
MVSLDNSFGNNGKVITNLGADEFGSDLTIDANGNIFVAGAIGNLSLNSTFDFKLLRYNSSGVRDTSFDGTADFDLDTDVGLSVALQPDGKPLVAGQAFIAGTTVVDYDFAVARYTSAGVLDTSFDSIGTTATDFDFGDDAIRGMRLQPDGKIVVAGYASNGLNYDFGLARYNNNGTLDTSFGASGRISTDFLGQDDEASDLLLQPDGKIIAVGLTREGNNFNFALARYNANGILDGGFGTGGKVTTDFAGLDDEAQAVTVQADGKILVVGRAEVGSNGDIAVVRYNANGTLDTTFGTGGKVTTDFFGKDDDAGSVHLQPDGKIIVTGTVGNTLNDDFGVVRYNVDGTFDTTFGTGGKLVTDLGGDDLAAKSVLTADGKLTIVGTTGTGGSVDDVALVRYVLNQAPTDVSLSSLSIAENQVAGTVVGTLATTDADAGDTFTYSLVTGVGSTDNAAFEIVGNQLQTKQAFDFETKKDYSIRVKTTDAFGTSFEKELKIAVSDVTETLPPPPPSQIFTPQQPKPTGDPIVGTRKNNRLLGTAQDDLIRGLKGNDKLNGRGGNDILVGGQGDDLMRGGSGDDVFRGGQGKDTCILNGGFDTIQRFADGEDKLKLTGGLTFANLTITQQGNDTLIKAGNNPIALITGNNPSLITATDFV